MTTAASTDRPTTHNVVLDLAMTSVSAVVALTLVRLFNSDDFALRLLVAVGSAHLIAAGLRRTRLSAALAIITSLTLGAVVISQLYLRDTTAFGLPTIDTFNTLGAELEAAFGPFRRLVAPVDAVPGFQLTLAITMWITATFADAALGRADAPIQAVTPTMAVFLFGSVMARSDRAVQSSLAVATTLGLLWLSVVGHRDRRLPWTSGDRSEGLASNRLWGMISLAVALFAVAVAAPLLPVSSTDAAIDLRRIGMGEGPQVVDSPLVGLTSLLSERSNEVMFTVDSATDHYWRLTALDEFDGDTWSSRRRYRDIDPGSSLVDDLPDRPTESHVFRIDGLQSSWLPVAYEPTTIQIDRDVRYDAESESLLVSDRTVPDLTYEVESLLVDLNDPANRRGLDLPDPESLALPLELEQQLASRASDIIGGINEPLDQALAIEQFFRSESNGFVYDERVDYRGEPVPVTAFLDARAGFCQQYASTFAALARSVGLPSRVAVGFTFGEASADGTQRVVRGRNAHAWPEVFFKGRGWLAFEPTPGRGNPDAESYTGRPAQQNNAGTGVGGSIDATSTTAPASPAAGLPSTTSTPDPEVPNDSTTSTQTRTTPRPWWRRPWLVIAAGVAIALLVAVIGRWLLIRRRRRPPSGAEPSVRVQHAWATGCHDLRTVGLVALASESPQEFAHRAAGYAGTAIVELGALETERRYRPDPLDAAEADRADAAAEHIRAVVVGSLDRVDRARFELDVARR